jgi:hypothetical protein
MSPLLTGPTESLPPKDYGLKTNARGAHSRVIVATIKKNPMGEANPHLDLSHPLTPNGGGIE